MARQIRNKEETNEALLQPVVIVGTELINKWTPPLADLVKSVSASEELVGVVKSFFFDDGM